MHHDLDADGGRVRVVQPVEQVARSMAVTGLDVMIEIVPADPPTPAASGRSLSPASGAGPAPA